MFTDGQPQVTTDSTQVTAANNAISQAKSTKENAKVFTIGVFSVVDTTNLKNSNYTIADYMNAVSSNYPQATSLSSMGTRSTDGVNYYATASDSEALNAAFQSVSSSVNSSSTSCELDADSVLKDIISGNLDLPEGFNATENVSVKTADYNGGAKAAESITFTDFDDENAAPLNNAKVKVDVSYKTVDVSGFDYKNNYVTGVANKDDTFSGKKLIVTITGLLPNQDGADMPSNEATSGIYDDGKLVAPFKVPTFNVGLENRVVDFGMTVDIADNVLNTYKATKTYGTFYLNDDAYYTYNLNSVKGDNGNYTFGFTGVDSSLYFADRAWTKVNVIPANNVYYDDAYLNGDDTGSSTFKDGQYGYEAKVPATTDTTSVSSGETTFTFKGRRIDVYCTTESSSGAVIGQLKAADGTVVATKLMRNEYESGALYNVPTLSFETPDASATYTLTITTNDQSNYKLDGVRVYHPADETNETVQNAYANDREQNAVFTQVRQLLISAEDFTSGMSSVAGAVYTDKLHDGATITDYEKIGPKNEVYLDNGDAIAFKVDGYQSGMKVMVGLSAPEQTTDAGDSVTAKQGQVTVSDGSAAKTQNISSNVDMYYAVTPTADGYVVITNTGSALISVTNVKLSGTAEGAGTFSVDDGLLAYMASFDSLEVTEPTPDEPDPIPDTPVQNDSISAIIHAIWAQVKTSIDRLFGRL